jgi:hypothetical protein
METTSEKTLLLDQFLPKVLGLFWFTAEDLGRDLAGFDDINYLFDGLISQFIYGKEEETTAKHTHIFFTENFKERIFLTHMKTQGLSKSQVAGEVDEHIALVGNHSKVVQSDRKTILILDTTADNWIAELKKRYPQFEFRELIP